MKRWWVLVVVILVALAVWVSLPDREPVGFVLISIDTLRADHLGAYGYPLDTSPFFDAFAARGTLFENAKVQLPGTLPSHMSIFTGLYPAEHGVYPPSRRTSTSASVLSREIPTLPELFQRAGYRTAAFSEGGYVAGVYGFSRGFDVYDDAVKAKPGGAAETVRRALEFVEGLRRDEKFFIFLHTYEVHDPYMAPEGYASWTGPVPGDWEPTGFNLEAASMGKLELAERQLEYFISLYDASIRFVDDQLRRFAEALWEKDFEGDVWVVITSDHGEEFMEHQKLAHGQVYDENLHVPLLIRRLGQRRGSRVSSLVESVDIAPTLLELAGIETAGIAMSGRSLVPALSDDGFEVRTLAYAESPNPPARTIYQQREDGLYQFLLRGEAPRLRRELFNLSEDPHAVRNLADQRRILLRELESKLELYDVEARAEAGKTDLTEEQAERLRALGYLQ